MPRSFTVEYKLSVLKWHHQNGEQKKKTARKFGLSPKRVREWLASEVKMQTLKGSSKKARKLGCGRQPLSPAVDEGVLDFLLEERAVG